MFCQFYLGSKLLAIVAIGLAMQQAGWIGHDYAHGRGSWMEWLCRTMTGSVNAFSRSWWSHKHNTHHVYTNNVGIDTDIANDPVFHLFFPSQDKDVWFRSYQHLYFVPAYSLLYLSWRSQSLQHAIATSQYLELMFMSINYIWLYTLGWPVAFGSVLLGGFLVASIVTATHQSESMLHNSNHSFVETHFLQHVMFDAIVSSWNGYGVVCNINWNIIFFQRCRNIIIRVYELSLSNGQKRIISTIDAKVFGQYGNETIEQ
jgi:fatty acid desaturase